MRKKPHCPGVVQGHLGWWACFGLRSWQVFFRGSATGGRRESGCVRGSAPSLFIVWHQIRMPFSLPESLAFLTSKVGWGCSLRFQVSLSSSPRPHHSVPSSYQRAEFPTCRLQLVQGVANGKASRGGMGTWSGKNSGLLCMTQNASLLEQCHGLY